MILFISEFLQLSPEVQGTILGAVFFVVLGLIGFYFSLVWRVIAAERDVQHIRKDCDRLEIKIETYNKDIRNDFSKALDDMKREIRGDFSRLDKKIDQNFKDIITLLKER